MTGAKVTSSSALEWTRTVYFYVVHLILLKFSCMFLFPSQRLRNICSDSTFATKYLVYIVLKWNTQEDYVRRMMSHGWVGRGGEAAWYHLQWTVISVVLLVTRGLRLIMTELDLTNSVSCSLNILQITINVCCYITYSIVLYIISCYDTSFRHCNVARVL